MCMMCGDDLFELYLDEMEALRAKYGAPPMMNWMWPHLAPAVPAAAATAQAPVATAPLARAPSAATAPAASAFMCEPQGE